MQQQSKSTSPTPSGLPRVAPIPSAKEVIERLARDPLVSTPGDVTQETERPRRFTETKEIHRNPTAVRSPEIELPPETKALRTERRSRAEYYRELLRLPFRDLTCEAYRMNEERTEGDGAEWERTRLFWFVWLIRGHADMRQFLKYPVGAFAKVEEQLKAWSASLRRKRELPPGGFNKDPWHEWFRTTRAEARTEFHGVWEKARYLPGHDPLEQAIDANRMTRLLLPGDIRAKRPVEDPAERNEQDYEFFIGIAGHLQVATGGDNIKLPCANLSVLLGVSKMTISRYRRWAVEDGFLTLMQEHKYRSKGKGDATEFQFDVSRWNALAKRAR